MIYPSDNLLGQSGLIRHLAKDESADTFVPILIFVVLKAHPENLLSNVESVRSYLLYTDSIQVS